MPILYPAQIIDRPCGHGKTTELINNLTSHDTYLIVVPYLTEVTRVIEGAAANGIEITEPTLDNDGLSKREHLLQLAAEGRNIVTTHAMYPRLSEAALEGIFTDYTVIIDEVVETVKPLSKNPSKGSWDELYLAKGFVTVDQETGQVFPTKQWEETHEAISDSLSVEVYNAAKSGTLYVHDSNTLVWALPKQLLNAGKALLVYTYLSRGSLMVSYLDRVGIPYQIDTVPSFEMQHLRKAKDLITVKLLKNLTDLKFSYRGQKTMPHGAAAKVSKTLSNLAARDLKDVPRENIIVTCSKEAWFENNKSHDDLEGTGRTAKAGKFASRSGLFNVNWLPNTTRGSNRWSHCSHVIYLYDQFAAPAVKHWLGMNGDWQDEYALSECVQLVWRSRVRKGEPITVYFASQRMHDLFMDYLNSVD
ncbi:hypothetical protein RYZ18_09145 [Roseovarius sp. 10]|uniref:hypothetical protein n=1 Tax=Roseovarius sp. 10 TaxID=3080563 RepID=UPI0029553548|nr:hypothetical protein [Roseovarius sp. 10]MDV7201491.1 hypothetical protein [Roseovarius sp. 10]